MTESGHAAEKLNVFISYSRHDLDFADQLVVTLELAGFAPTIDRVGIHGAADWEKQLGKMVREADTVVFLLSPASAASKWCSWEVKHAVAQGKRIIPVVCNALGEIPPPPELSRLNFIFFYEEPSYPGSGWPNGMRELNKVLREDFDWLQEHTRLLKRAVEWADGDRARARLLSGQDIKDAKAWAARQPRDAPPPTTLHLDFILASEQWEIEQTSTRRRELEERERLVREAEASRAARDAAQADALAHAKRAKRNAMWFSAVMILLTVTSAITGWWAWAQSTIAHNEASAAENSRKRAVDEARRAKEATEVVGVLNSQVLDPDEPPLSRLQRQRQTLLRLEQLAESRNVTAMVSLGRQLRDGAGTLGDLAKAKTWFEKAASHGDASAMNSIGILYATGRGFAKDEAKAREWYEKAAALGYPVAMSNLGAQYAGGRGVPQDHVKAREWYEKAAAAGNSTAMNLLGSQYANGRGVVQDHAKAREWYEKAAAAGNSTAMTNLGLQYANGRGVLKDYAKAHEWYEKAAAAGNSAAMTYLGSQYEIGRGVSQDNAKAKEWYEQAAAAGNAAGMNNLGALYHMGLGTPRDPIKARQWYEKAAAAGISTAMNNLGDIHANGEGVPRDYDKAREWFIKAAAGGHAGAMNTLGEMYATGRGAAQDLGKAREWYEKAEAAGDTEAMKSLGRIYAEGQGVSQDPAKAREWYEKAAAKGDTEAMDSLGRIYAEGQGVAKDFAKAREWFEKIAEAGEASGLQSLAWYALLSRDPTLALSAAERAMAMDADRLDFETHRAHALMYLGRSEEARAFFVSRKDRPMLPGSSVVWQSTIADEFEALREAGLVHPQMTEIEVALGIAH